MSTSAMRALLTPEDAARALEDARDHLVVVYKHSPVCDISEGALDEVHDFLRTAPADLDVRIVDVLSARPASQWIEARTGVRHESPQALVLARGEVAWHASHRRITADALRQAVDAARATA